MRRCPACAELLKRKRVEAVEVDGCPGCGGLWLDGGELKTLGQNPAALRAAAESVRPGLQVSIGTSRSNACPVCEGPLTPFEYDRFRGIRLDRCKACGGVWLDHGEAQAIASRLEAELVPQPPAPPQGDDPPLELASAPRFDPRPPEPPPPESFAPGRVSGSSGRLEFDPHRPPSHAGRLVAGAIVVALVAWWFWPVWLPKTPLQPAASNASGADPCEGKERCVVAVVAPWCPACKQAIPMINQLCKRFEGSDRVGIKPVIAWDKEPALEATAETLSGPAFLDPTGSLMKAVGGDSVPRWYVVNRSGRVLKEGGRVYADVEDHLEYLGLDGD